MTTTAVHRRRGAAASADARAAKERRQKIIAFVGLGVLVVVLAIEAPSLLNRGSGGGTSSTTSSVPSVTPALAPTAPVSGKAYRAALRSAPHDVFVATRVSGAIPAYGSASTPAGLHDPFAAPGSGGHAVELPQPPVAPPPAAALPAKIVIGAPGAGRVASSGWIVILASIPTAQGQSAASSFARSAGSHGIGSISILNSSNRRPLRGGYWVVYTGPYPTLAAVTNASSDVHSRGYGDAYIRQLIVYRKK